MGTSNNCHRSSGAPNLPTNDSALFSFRFRAVHPKDLRDSQLRQLFEVPNSENERHAIAAGSPTTKSSLFEVPLNLFGLPLLLDYREARQRGTRRASPR